jgi:thiol-disulfide isomerase/thioredoxin
LYGNRDSVFRIPVDREKLAKGAAQANLYIAWARRAAHALTEQTGRNCVLSLRGSIMRAQWFFVIEVISALAAAAMALWLVRRLRRRGGRSTIRSRIASIAIGAAALLAGAVFGFYSFVVQPMFAPGSEENGRSLAAFRFQSVSDDSWHSLGEYRGRVVLLNVWATWCGPCREETPALERIQRELGPQGVTVLMVSSEEPAVIRGYLAKHGNAVLQGYVGDLPESRKTMDMQSRPYSFIVDRQGIVREFIVGTGSYGSFFALIRRYL